MMAANKTTLTQKSVGAYLKSISDDQRRRDCTELLGLMKRITGEEPRMWGWVSFNIAHDDYLNYQDSLSFDQLCKSLGRVFVEFFEMFHRGEGSQVIDRLNALRVNPYA